MSMSKIAFISDIHGNFSALIAVLEDIKANGIGKIFCLGDLVGYYSQINEVIDTIRENNIKCIVGNHDYAMIHNNGEIIRSKTCTNVLKRQIEYISKSNLSFLQSLETSMTLDIGKYKIFAVHGGLNNYIDEYINEFNVDYFSRLDSSITHVITAHNHKPIVKSFGRIQYANSGSVGQPRDYNPQAGYVIFENGQFSIVRIEYNIGATIQKMKEDGFPEYIADILKRGCQIGG